MSSKQNESNTKRELSGVLAATLGLVALACSDDDGAPAAGGDGANEAGAPASAGKSSSPQAGKSNGSGDGGSPTLSGEGGAGGVSEPAVDIEPLNALLSAEYNAITAYTAGASLIGAAPASDPLYGLADVITKIAVDIQAQHQLHAAALVEAIEALGGTPVDEADIAKAFTPPDALVDNPTISNVLKLAAGAERAAAVAYNQVLAGLEQAQHRFLAAAIEGDETQHFIVLAALVLGLADPGANLSADTAEAVVPQAFVSKVGDEPGLNAAPADYFP